MKKIYITFPRLDIVFKGIFKNSQKCYKTNVYKYLTIIGTFVHSNTVQNYSKSFSFPAKYVIQKSKYDIQMAIPLLPLQYLQYVTVFAQ